MVRTPRRKGRLGGDDANSKKSGDEKLSPLSNRPDLWDSPPGSRSTRGSTPSSQRKLFRLEAENLEKVGTCKKKKGGGKSTDFSSLFPEGSSIGPRKSILLEPRLTRLHSLLPDTLSAEEKSTDGTSSAQANLAPKSPPKKKCAPKLSPRKADPTSPLHPPRTLARANADPNYLNDFTLTPTVLYDNNDKGHYYNHRPLMAPMSAGGNQHYHQSPHWSGQVRVNPFSPVPEQYLRPPPTSTKSASRGSRKNRPGPGFYSFMNLGPPTVPNTGGPELLAPRKKKPRLNAPTQAAASAIPRFDDEQDLFSGISPTDVAHGASGALDISTSATGTKRKAAQDALMMPLPQSSMPPPQSMDADALDDGSNKRMRINRGRYLNDFQEVQYLGAGSFGSVNACLSRLDGVVYAVKSISPSGQIRKGNDNTGADGHAGIGGADYLYGGLKTMSNQCAIPPTPRRDLVPSPLKRRKSKSRLGLGLMDESRLAGDHYDLGALEGSSHWNEGALRRMLREVFALAALCQQDDVRTFHIVRYQQAWLEDDGTLYIQTELCSATLRDEMSGKISNGAHASGRTIDVFRQLKVLREVLLALELVHQQGMVHLDIKPENIFLKNNTYKLGDFGLANVFTKNGGGASAAPDVEEGDSRYMSKDLLDFCPSDLTKCDIFSLGITMYEICSGLPLPLCGQEWQDLRNGKVPFLPGTMPCLNAIIKEMMHPDPEKRPSATDLLSRDALSLGVEDSKFMSQKSSAYKIPAKARSTQPSLKRCASWSL